jgi:hypothetical protein
LARTKMTELIAKAFIIICIGNDGCIRVCLHVIQ